MSPRKSSNAFLSFIVDFVCQSIRHNVLKQVSLTDKQT